MVFSESSFRGVPPESWCVGARSAGICLHLPLRTPPPAQEHACFLPSTGLCSRPAWCFPGLGVSPGRSSGCRVHAPSHSPGGAGLRCPPPLSWLPLCCALGAPPTLLLHSPSLSAPATALGAEPGVFLTLLPDPSFSVLLCPGPADLGPSCPCTQLGLCNSGPSSWESMHRQLKEEDGWLNRESFLSVIFFQCPVLMCFQVTEASALQRGPVPATCLPGVDSSGVFELGNLCLHPLKTLKSCGAGGG